MEELLNPLSVSTFVFISTKHANYIQNLYNQEHKKQVIHNYILAIASSEQLKMKNIWYLLAIANGLKLCQLCTVDTRCFKSQEKSQYVRDSECSRGRAFEIAEVNII